MAPEDDGLTIEGLEVELAPVDERPEYPTDIAPTPPDETPPPADPEPPAPDTGPALPAWLADVPAEDQPAMLDSWLSRLDPQQRASLPAVNELLSQVQGSTANQTRAEVRAEAAQAQEEALILSMVERMRPHMTEQGHEDFTREIETFRTVEGRKASAQEMRKGVVSAYQHLGLDIGQIPDDVKAAAGAPGVSPGDAAAIYMVYAASVVGQATDQVATQRESARMKADEGALRLRIEHETVGKLAKEGRVKVVPDADGVSFYLQAVKDQTPPPMGDGSPAATFSGINADTYRRMNESNEAVDTDVLDAWTRANFAEVDG